MVEGARPEFGTDIVDVFGNEPITEAELEGYRTYAEAVVAEDEKPQEALEQNSMRIAFRLDRRERPR